MVASFNDEKIMKKHRWFVFLKKLGLPFLIFILVFSPRMSSFNILRIPTNFLETLANISKHNVEAQSPQTVYVATTQEDCGSFTPCYTNTDGIDDINGQGTGLRDAVVDVNNGDEIIILDTYSIKDHTVLIDKNLTVRGYQNAQITYPGSNCGLSMLNFTSGGILKDLTITGGECTGSSRDLITLGTSQDFRIEHSTLQGGNRAVNLLNNTGNITIAFNQISENLEYAIYQNEGQGAGIVNIYANNIHDNRTGAQVNCKDLGMANHNFWGEEILPSTATENCDVVDEKRLGAPILVLSENPGVQAVRQTISDNISYAFDENVGVKRNTGTDYELVIVNHGQGTEENIPFLESGTTPIVACSNFYDLFLAEDAAASDLVLTLKYDLNESCITAVESSDFCSQEDDSKYPLWWYDPAHNLTDGWDRTGQIPEGDNPLNVEGQTTTCNLTENEIQVVIDSSGRPGITQDLNFTPFIAGIPIGSSNIAAFEATLNIDEVNIYWQTGLESKISGYHVLRANSETGPYYKLSSLIPSTGSNSFYEFTDLLDSAEFNKNYYYKIEIINSYGDTIRTHGPVSVLTSTPTPSPTPTRTLYPTRTPYPTSTSGPTRTATQYIYRSPTSYYRPRTATPYPSPTTVRTDRPTPTITHTLSSNQIYHTESAQMTVTAQIEEAQKTSSSSASVSQQLSQTPSPGSVPSNDPETAAKTSTQNALQQTEFPGDNSPETEQIHWGYLLIGAGTSLGILTAAGFMLTKHTLNI